MLLRVVTRTLIAVTSGRKTTPNLRRRFAQECLHAALLLTAATTMPTVARAQVDQASSGPVFEADPRDEALLSKADNGRPTILHRAQDGIVTLLSARMPDYRAKSAAMVDLGGTAASFVSASATELGLPPHFDAKTLIFNRVEQLDDGDQLLKAFERVGGIRVAFSDISFLFDRDNTLVMMTGRIWAPAPIAILSSSDRPVGVPSDAELTIDPLISDAAWLEESDEAFTFRSRLGSVYRILSKVLTANRSAKIKVHSMSASSVSPGSDIQAVQYLGADPDFLNPSFCYYQLRYDSSLHQINRVDRYNVSDVSIYFSCSSQPFMTSGTWATSGTYREGEAFHWVKNARDFSGTVHSSVSPIRTDPLSIEVDSPTVPSGATGSYLNRKIKLPIPCNTPGGGLCWEPMDVAHEAGHHFHWTYNDISTACAQGAIESLMINETVGNVFAFLTADYKVGALNYGVSGLINPQHDGSHFAPYEAGCPSVPHAFGTFFEQGVWEALQASDQNGQVTFTWSEASARAHLGRALAYALKVGSIYHNYSDLGALMYSYLLGAAGTTNANAFKSVMNHHGTGI